MVTVNSDGLTMFNISLTQEYLQLAEKLGFFQQGVRQHIFNEVKDSFMLDDVKENMKRKFYKEWERLLDKYSGSVLSRIFLSIIVHIFSFASLNQHLQPHTVYSKNRAQFLIGLQVTCDSMRRQIFSERERWLLENFITEAGNKDSAVSEVLQKIKKYEALFEDVYLYLQVRKTIT